MFNGWLELEVLVNSMQDLRSIVIHGRSKTPASMFLTNETLYQIINLILWYLWKIYLNPYQAGFIYSPLCVMQKFAGQYITVFSTDPADLDNLLSTDECLDWIRNFVLGGLSYSGYNCVQTFQFSKLFLPTHKRCVTTCAVGVPMECVKIFEKHTQRHSGKLKTGVCKMFHCPSSIMKRCVCLVLTF